MEIELVCVDKTTSGVYHLPWERSRCWLSHGDGAAGLWFNCARLFLDAVQVWPPFRTDYSTQPLAEARGSPSDWDRSEPTLGTKHVEAVTASWQQAADWRHCQWCPTLAPRAFWHEDRAAVSHWVRLNIFFPIREQFCPLSVQIAQTGLTLPRWGLTLPRITPPTPVLYSAVTNPFRGYVRTQNTPNPTPKHPFSWP